ncbi:hypothetical protein QAD02_017787 [Eretmocerus hayati]|uniref:Uncharacterized protein n=1 Tax=Eretmocerus hayati TaxID=131215 RepID=A0ACC2PEY4_9HYME|nr:hypothetical protein QAD02_017787 [Eretmocerus hayati]
MVQEVEPIVIVSEPILIIPEKAFKNEADFGKFLVEQGISKKSVDILIDQSKYAEKRASADSSDSLSKNLPLMTNSVSRAQNLKRKAPTASCNESDPAEPHYWNEIKHLRKSVEDGATKMMTGLKVSSKFTSANLTRVAESTETLLSEISEVSKITLTNFLKSIDVDFTPEINTFKFPKALRLNIYFDEVVVNNKLGNKVSPHKLEMFYFTIQNLPKFFNSLLGGIHVFGIAYAADITKYGFHKVLQPFLNDLEKFESDEGVSIKIGSEDYVLRAGLASFSGDGLAAHQVFELLAPGALHFCRMCMISRDDFHKDINSSAVLRTKEQHAEQLKILNQQKTQKDYLEKRTEFGINGDSALHKSRSWHFTNNWVFDPMHDIFEGNGPLALKLVFLHFISHPKYQLTVEKLNNRIDQFDYGSSDIKDKPSGNFNRKQLSNLSDHKIRQTSAQTWCLMRIFPFLVSDLVDSDDEHLQLIILLNKITEIVLCPVTCLSILPYSRILIQDFNSLFEKLFPEVNPINKLHHWLHYWDCIRFSGPMRPFCCFRFEAKHREFTKYGCIGQNFKNLSKSMIDLAQTKQAAVWGGKEVALGAFDYSHAKEVCVVQTLSKEKLMHDISLRENDKVEIVSKISIHGAEFLRNSFVALENWIDAEKHNGTMIFGRILEIVIYKKDQVYLYCEEWPVQYLEESLNAYAVIKGDQEIDGHAFSKMTEEKYEKIGVTAGSIIKLIELRDRISGFSVVGSNNLPERSVQDPSPLNDVTHATQNTSNCSENSSHSSLDLDSTGDEVPHGDVTPSSNDENSHQYSQVYPVREWASKTLVGKKLVNFVGILESGVFSRSDRSNALLGIVRNFIKIHPNGYYPDASDKIQLAVDIINQFPKLRDSTTTLGCEYLYDPISCSGLIQEKFKALKVGLPKEEKKRVRASKPARKKGSQTPSEPSTVQCEVPLEASNSQPEAPLGACTSGSDTVEERRTSPTKEEYEAYIKELQAITPTDQTKQDIFELMDITREQRQIEIKMPTKEPVPNQEPAPDQEPTPDQQPVSHQEKILDRFPRFLDFDGEVLFREYAACYKCADFKEQVKIHTPKILKYCQKVYPEKLARISSFSQEGNNEIIIPPSHDKLTIYSFIDYLSAIVALSEIIPLSKIKRSSKTPKLEKPCPNPNLLQIDHESDDSLVVNLLHQNTEGIGKQPFMKCNLRDGKPLNFRILMDGKTILIGEGTLSTFELLVKIHYIFHIEFCEQLEDFFNFVTSFFMEVGKPTTTNASLNISLNNVEI